MVKVSGETTVNYQWSERRPATAGGIRGYIVNKMIPAISMQVGAVLIGEDGSLVGYIDGSGTEPNPDEYSDLLVGISNGRRDVSSITLDLDKAPDEVCRIVITASSFNGARLHETESNAVTVYRGEKRVATYTVPVVDEFHEDGYGGVQHNSSAAVYSLTRSGDSWQGDGVAIAAHGRSTAGCAMEVARLVRGDAS